MQSGVTVNQKFALIWKNYFSSGVAIPTRTRNWESFPESIDENSGRNKTNTSKLKSKIPNITGVRKKPTDWKLSNLTFLHK